MKQPSFLFVTILVLSAIICQGQNPFPQKIEVSENIGQDPFFIDAADFNKDGKNDILVVSTMGLADFSGLSIYFQKENNTFEPEEQRLLGGEMIQIAKIVDFNKDNNPDILIGTSENQIALAINDGSGNFDIDIISSGPITLLDLVILDLDGDNNPEIISGGNDILFFQNLGNGFFGEAQTIENLINSAFVRKLIPTQLNSDQFIDIAFIQNTPNNSVIVSGILNNGDGTFGELKTLTEDVDFRDDVFFFDFDLDNDIDLYSEQSNG